MTAIDVGANRGVVTLLMREAVSIDPSPTACRRVAEQAALNGYANVVVEQIALGVADGTQETYFAASVGIGALPPADAQYVTSEAVDVG